MLKLATMRLLAGDVGGTKTLLGIYEGSGDALREVRTARYDSGDFDGLTAIIDHFLGEDGVEIDRAGFGVAGPVVDDRARTTNLPWTLDAQRLSDSLGAPVALVNDFAAVAYGVRSLGPDERVVLQEGTVDPEGPVAILGAGTGLGQALIIPTGADPLHVLPSEGGHADFAPRDELEIGLLRFLLERHDRVSVERAVSGPGLAAIYDLVVSRRILPENPEVRRRLQAGGDAGRVIGEHALAGDDAACSRAVSIFLSLYGAEAGNLALRVIPTGGLYVGGGIAPRLLPLIQTGVFMESFLRKGRMRPLLERVRVTVIDQPRVGLLGARNAALVLLNTTR